MLKQLLSFFIPARRGAVADGAIFTAEPTSQVAQQSLTALKESNFMDEIYHHGLCAQGRIALDIDSESTQQRRFSMVMDAIAVMLWGGSLFGLMWLGFAAGF